MIKKIKLLFPHHCASSTITPNGDIEVNIKLNLESLESIDFPKKIDYFFKNEVGLSDSSYYELKKHVDILAQREFIMGCIQE